MPQLMVPRNQTQSGIIIDAMLNSEDDAFNQADQSTTAAVITALTSLFSDHVL